MAFESLSERLNGVFKKLRGKGKLSEADIKAAMREVRMALLEADVNYKVAKMCIRDRTNAARKKRSCIPLHRIIRCAASAVRRNINERGKTRSSFAGKRYL